MEAVVSSQIEGTQATLVDRFKYEVCGARGANKQPAEVRRIFKKYRAEYPVVTLAGIVKLLDTKKPTAAKAVQPTTVVHAMTLGAAVQVLHRAKEGPSNVSLHGLTRGDAT